MAFLCSQTRQNSPSPPLQALQTSSALPGVSNDHQLQQPAGIPISHPQNPSLPPEDLRVRLTSRFPPPPPPQSWRSPRGKARPRVGSAPPADQHHGGGQLPPPRPAFNPFSTLLSIFRPPFFVVVVCFPPSKLSRVTLQLFSGRRYYCAFPGLKELPLP